MSDEIILYREYRLARILKTPLSELETRNPADEFERMAFMLARRIKTCHDEKTGQIALAPSLWLFAHAFKMEGNFDIVKAAICSVIGDDVFTDELDFGVDIETFELVRHVDSSKFIGYAHSDGIFGESIRLFKNKNLTYAIG